ncbi:histidine kinase dimerization/phospho-acceptor domain-containing protein [Terrilactibacillus sp. S3-3]|nr:histidine kinase dimerization/phospho-acceptor domain-containing protein [Terrilactibacillus sp. S3-3]
MATIHEFWETTVRVLILSAIAGILIGSLAIYRFSRRLSKPLAEVTNTIKLATSTEDLEVTVPIPERPQEMKDLAIAFNHLMNRLSQQIQREKNFVSDASHELRTPLAAIRGHVKLIMRHGNEHPEVIEESAQFINQESHACSG